MLSDLRAAIGFLTIAPVRHRGLDRSNAGHVMLWAPFVGVLLSACAGVVILLARFMTDPNGKLSLNATLGRLPGSDTPFDVGLVPAVLGFAVIVALTRGLHLDGLADTADALGSYQDKPTALTIMRKPDLGPLGMVTVLFVVLFDVAALTLCINNHRGTTSLLTAVITGRLAMTLACTPSTPSARTEGLGALVAGAVSRTSAAMVGAATIAVAAGGALLDPHSEGRTKEAIQAVVAVVLGCAVAHLFRSHCVRRFGGITGDVLGALNEVGTVVAMLVMATSV